MCFAFAADGVGTDEPSQVDGSRDKLIAHYSHPRFSKDGPTRQKSREAVESGERKGEGPCR
jgi:hypothetical protein